MHSRTFITLCTLLAQSPWIALRLSQIRARLQMGRFATLQALFFSPHCAAMKGTKRRAQNKTFRSSYYVMMRQ